MNVLSVTARLIEGLKKETMKMALDWNYYEKSIPSTRQTEWMSWLHNLVVVYHSSLIPLKVSGSLFLATVASGLLIRLIINLILKWYIDVQLLCDNVYCLCLQSNTATSICLGFSLALFCLLDHLFMYLTRVWAWAWAQSKAEHSRTRDGRTDTMTVTLRASDSPSWLCSGTLLPSWCLIRPFPRNPLRVPRYTLCGRSSLPDRVYTRSTTSRTEEEEEVGKEEDKDKGKKEKRERERF